MATDIQSWLEAQGLTDQQRSSVESEGRHLFISAGAGTGKTKTITTKVAYLMAKRNAMAFDQISDLLAITFTRKAAGELSSRMRRVLKENGRPDEAQKVDSAWVSTIHGMCARILRDSALEIGTDPKFSICTDDTVSSLQAQAINQVLSAADGRYEPLFREYRVDSFGGYDHFSVTGVSETMLRKRSLAVNAAEHPMELGPAPKTAAEILEEAAAVLGETVCALEAEAKPTQLTLETISFAEDSIAAVKAGLREVLGEPSEEERLKMAADVLAVALQSDNYSTRQSAKTHTRACRDKMWDLAFELRLAVAYPHISLFAELADKIIAQYRQLKRERGEMDNDDLLAALYKAFSEHPQLVRKYADTFKLMLIDEFQDTDQIQTAIAKMLSQASDTNSLVTVGDAQQSIYRFRGADVNLFRKYQGEISESEQRTMSTNFRSHEDVLDYVNTVFGTEQVFNKDGRYIKLSTPGPSPRDGSRLGSEPRVSLLLTCTSSSTRTKASSDAMARLEALRIAVAFDHYRKMGYEPREMALLLRSLSRVEEYTDILREIGFDAVITGGTIFWKQYEPALVRHILRFMANPNNDEASYFVLSSPLLDLEPRDLAILAQWRRSAKGAVYRPPLYEALTSEESHADLGDRAKRAIKLLGNLLADNADKPSQAIRRFADESGYLTRLAEEGMAGTQKAANFMKALRFVEEIEEDSSASVPTVAWRYAELMDSEPKHGPGVLSTEDPNAIQVMTIHSSKGLEFPVVALGGFDSPVKVDDGFMLEDFGANDYVSLKGDKIAKRWKECEPAKGYLPAGINIEAAAPYAKELVPRQTNRLRYHRYLQAAILNEEQEETRRLFYVGATRARDALVMAIQPPIEKDTVILNSVIREDMADMFPEGMFPLEDGLYDLNDGGCLDYRFIHVESTAHAEELFDQIYEECFGEEYEESRNRASSRLPQGHLSFSVNRALENADYHEFSYSTLPEYRGKDYRRLADEARDGRPVKKRARSREERDKIRSTALSLGNALHAYMEYQVLTGEFAHAGEVVDETKLRQIASQHELAEKEQERFRKAVSAWNGSDLAARARSFDRVHTEVPFYVRFEEETGGAEGHKPIYFTGEIDLLCHNDAPDDARAFVVDYKTGGEQDDSKTYLKSKHRLQAHCYAYAAFEKGFSIVDVEFACMEHEADGGGLLSVAYHFEADDRELVKAVIYDSWKQQNGPKKEASEEESPGTSAKKPDVQQAIVPERAPDPEPPQGERDGRGEVAGGSGGDRVVLLLEVELDDAATGEASEAVDGVDREELTPDEDQLLDDIAAASKRFEGHPTSAEVTFVDPEGGTSLAMLCWRDERVVLLSADNLLGFEECFGEFDEIEGWTVLKANEVSVCQVVEAVCRC